MKEKKKSKILVVYYSKTGNTRKVGNDIAKEIGADVEEIIDKKNRKGFFNFFKSGRDGMKGRLTEISETKFNPLEYDLVIIGTPIWGWNITPAIRTYLSKNKFNKIGFYSTSGGSGGKKVFEEIEKTFGLKPVRTIDIFEKEIKSGNYSEKIKKFVENLK